MKMYLIENMKALLLHIFLRVGRGGYVLKFVTLLIISINFLDFDPGVYSPL